MRFSFGLLFSVMSVNKSTQTQKTVPSCTQTQREIKKKKTISHRDMKKICFKYKKKGKQIKSKETKKRVKKRA